MLLSTKLCSLKELTTIRESLSRMICLRSSSQVSCTPSSIDLSSICNAPKGSSTLVVIDPIICPLSFLITTPIPQPPTSLNIAPSVLTLYHPYCGGDHDCEAKDETLIGVWWSYLNSSVYSITNLVNASYPLHHPPCAMVFLLFQRLYVVTINVTQSMFEWDSITTHTRSMKSLN